MGLPSRAPSIETCTRTGSEGALPSAASARSLSSSRTSPDRTTTVGSRIVDGIDEGLAADAAASRRTPSFVRSMCHASHSNDSKSTSWRAPAIMSAIFGKTRIASTNGASVELCALYTSSRGTVPSAKSARYARAMTRFPRSLAHAKLGGGGAQSPLPATQTSCAVDAARRPPRARTRRGS
jgi:hypothetical protein